jgi:hypothetical protein
MKVLKKGNRMKNNQRSVSFVVLLILLTTFLFPSKILATKWAYPFVVWNDYIYVVSEEYVVDIDSKIGKVTYYSDMEQHSGNFSNEYRKGTTYYSITGISKDDSIPIEVSDGRYVKANREGPYEVIGESVRYSDGHQGTISIFIFLIMGIIAITLIYKVKKNNH